MTGSKPVRSLKVLLVENYDDSRLVFYQTLSLLGHEVRCAGTMPEGLEALREEVPEVLISDIGLPDGDGWELRQLAVLPPEVFSIAMSGYGMAANIEHSMAVGYRYHLIKPVDLDALEALLVDAARERDAADG